MNVSEESFHLPHDHHRKSDFMTSANYINQSEDIIESTSFYITSSSNNGLNQLNGVISPKEVRIEPVRQEEKDPPPEPQPPESDNLKVEFNEVIEVAKAEDSEKEVLESPKNEENTTVTSPKPENNQPTDLSNEPTSTIAASPKNAESPKPDANNTAKEEKENTSKPADVNSTAETPSKSPTNTTAVPATTTTATSAPLNSPPTTTTVKPTLATLPPNQTNNHHHHNSSNNHHTHHSHNHHHPSNNHYNNHNINNPLNGVINRTITLEELRKYFHLPIAEVARQFGTCTTALKKICRRLNITKWPYRQILSLTKSIQSLEMAALNEGVAPNLRQQYRNQIQLLQKGIAEVIKNPSKVMEAMNHPNNQGHHLENEHQDLLDFEGNMIMMEDDNMMIDDDVPPPVSSSSSNLPLTVLTETKEGESISLKVPTTSLKPETANNSSNGSGNANANDTVSMTVNGVLNAAKKKLGEIDTEEVRQIIQAATGTLGTTLEAPAASSSASSSHPTSFLTISSSSGAVTTKKPTTVATKAIKRSNEDQGNEDFMRIKRGKSVDDVNLNGVSGGVVGGRMSIGGMIIPDAVSGNSNDLRKPSASNNSSSSNNHPSSSAAVSLALHNNLLAAAMEISESLNSNQNGRINANTNTSGGPQNPYLMDVGLTTVTCHYNQDQNKYHFNGQVNLAQLQRKKFRPNMVRKVVPLMEPDIGSNYSVDFFPNITMPKY